MTDLVNYDEFQAVLAARGIKPENLTAAEVDPISTATNFESLVIPGAVDVGGVSVRGATGCTPVLIFLSVSFAESQKYEGYLGFYVVTVLNTADKREYVITLSKPVNESANEPGATIERMQPGNLFRVAQIRTNSGNDIYRCVPLA